MYLWYVLATSAAAAAGALRFITTSIRDMKQQMPSRGRPIIPVVRNLHFGLMAPPFSTTDADDVLMWNSNGRFVSLFMAAMSIFFPSGELMFCRAVKAHMYHPNVKKDEKLLEAASAFISQEAVHGREHDYYNGQLEAKLPIAGFLGRVVKVVTEFVTRRCSHRRALTATVALEHWTAIMAGHLLDHTESTLGDVEGSKFKLIWRWHAMEETEHKAVAFDVFERVYGRGVLAYMMRCGGMLLSTFLFWTLVFLFTLILVIHDGSLLNFREWGLLLRTLFIHPGVITRIVGPWCDFFRFDFHPWDHNNADKLTGMEELQRQVEEACEGRTTPVVCTTGAQ